MARRPSHAKASEPESSYAWGRLAVASLLSTIGGVGMWSVVVALPAVQAEFGVGARRRVAALHADDDRLRLRRHPDGPARRSLRRSSCRWSLGAVALALGYVARGLRRDAVAVHAGARPADRRRQLRDVRAAGRRHVAVVHAPARHRRGDLRQRQLPRRHRLAADRAALHRRRRLARRPIRRSACSASSTMLPLALLLRRPPPAHDAGRRGRRRRPRHAHALGLSPAALQALLVVAGCRCCVAMSMPQVHHRRLLRRPRLRRRARRPDAVADARLRHREPARLRLDLRPHRRLAHAAARLGAAGRRAAAVPAVRRAGVALRDLGAVRPVPGRHRADLRDHRARVLPAAARPARASAS